MSNNEMPNNEMLYCLVAFILGYLFCKQTGNSFIVGAPHPHHDDLPVCQGDAGYLHEHGQFRTGLKHSFNEDPCRHADAIAMKVRKSEAHSECGNYYKKEHATGDKGLICEDGTEDKDKTFWYGPCKASEKKCRIDPKKPQPIDWDGL